MTLTWKQIAVAVSALLLIAAGWMIKATWFPQVPDDCFQLDYSRLEAAPAHVLLLRPTHFANSRRSGTLNWQVSPRNAPRDPGNYRMVGRNATLTQLMAAAYQRPEADVVLPPEATTNRYDFLVTVDKQPAERLRKLVHKELGYMASTREDLVEVLHLKVATPGAEGLRPSTNLFSRGSAYKAGKLQMRHQPVQSLLYLIEETCKKPVRDKTGLTGFYDFDLEWRRSGGDQPMTVESVRRSLGAMGLTLTTDTELLPALVVERRK